MDRRSVWLHGLRIGLCTLRREPLLALRRLVFPVSYWRTAEFAYVLQGIPPTPGARVLDLGSPKDLSVVLARQRGQRVVATDILLDSVRLGLRYAWAQGRAGSGSGRVEFHVADGRRLPYPDNAFDHAFSVSVLEHIPDDGDKQAVSELSRVVRPGGRIVVTVPFDKVYRETWVDRDVYERERVGQQPVFWQRHYDEAALGGRLIAPSRADVVALSFWGEGRIPVERILDRIRRVRLLDVLMAPTHPLLSLLCLREVTADNRLRPMAAFLTLRV